MSGAHRTSRPRVGRAGSVGRAGRVDRGTVTAELAVALPALVFVTVLCVWAVTAMAVYVRCLDAARTGARELARGEPEVYVRQVVTARAPGSASVELMQLDGDLVAVQVRARVRLPVGWAGAPAVTVGGRVVAAAESGSGPP